MLPDMITNSLNKSICYLILILEFLMGKCLFNTNPKTVGKCLFFFCIAQNSSHVKFPID